MTTTPAPARKGQQSRTLSGFLALFGLTRYGTQQQYFYVQLVCVPPGHIEMSSSAEVVDVGGVF